MGGWLLLRVHAYLSVAPSSLACIILPLRQRHGSPRLHEPPRMDPRLLSWNRYLLFALYYYPLHTNDQLSATHAQFISSFILHIPRNQWLTFHICSSVGFASTQSISSSRRAIHRTRHVPLRILAQIWKGYLGAPLRTDMKWLSAQIRKPSISPCSSRERKVSGCDET